MIVIPWAQSILGGGKMLWMRERKSLSLKATSDHKPRSLTALSAQRFSRLRAGVLKLYSAFADAEGGRISSARLPHSPETVLLVEWVSCTDLTMDERPLGGVT